MKYISLTKGLLSMIKGYKFTKKKNPKKGIMSTILGVISTVSIIVAIYLTYERGGEAVRQYADASILALIFSIVGITFSIQALMKKDIYKFFPVFGLILNVLVVLMAGFILYMGIF